MKVSKVCKNLMLFRMKPSAISFPLYGYENKPQADLAGYKLQWRYADLSYALWVGPSNRNATCVNERLYLARYRDTLTRR